MSRVVDARACVTSRIVAVLATERAGRFCLDLDETWDFEAGDLPSAVGRSARRRLARSPCLIATTA